MYTIPVGAIIEMQWRAFLQSQQVICTFHYENSVSIIDGPLALQEYIENFGVTMGDGLRGHCTTDVQTIRWRGQVVHPTRYVHLEVIPAQTAGALAPPTVSIGTSVVCRKLTDLAARNARGRIFYPGIPTSYLNIGTLTTTAETNLRVAIAEQLPVNIQAATEGGEAMPVVWSYTAPARRTLIRRGTVDQFVRYQRRREVGRGI